MTLPLPDAKDPRWRCVLVGSDSLLIECATQWQDRNHEVAAVVSAQPAVVAWATRSGIPVVDQASALCDADLSPFDYLFDLTNPATLPADVLALPRQAAIHVHDGLLPGYAGLNAPVWALLKGERRHGVSWHVMTARAGIGDLLLTRSFGIDDDDSAVSMHAKCLVAARHSFATLIAGLAQGAIVPQPSGRGVNHSHGMHPRPAQAGMINWRTNAHDIAHLVRALDHGAGANPLAAPKISMNGQVLLVGAASVQGSRSGRDAGTILSVQAGSMVVATATCDLRIGRITTCEGRAITRFDELAGAGCVAGAMLDRLSVQQRQALSSLSADIAHIEPWWRQRLIRRRPLHLPQVNSDAERGREQLRQADQSNLCPEGPRCSADRTVMSALIAYLGRIGDRSGVDHARFDLGYADPILLAPFAGFEPWFSGQFPLDVALHFDRGLSCLRETLGGEIRQLRRKVGHAADLFARSPELRADGASDPSTLPVVIQIVDHLQQARPHPHADLTIALQSDSRACRWFYQSSRLSADAIAAMQAGFLTFLAAAKAAPDLAIGLLPTVAHDRPQTDLAWTQAMPGSDQCLHQIFARQATRTPDSPAVTCRDRTLTYGELDRLANRLAWHVRELGVGPDCLVGLNMGRSLNLVIALIAIHKAGGAYVPLSSSAQPERIAGIIADCRPAIILTDTAGMAGLPHGDVAVLCLDDDWSILAAQSDEPVPDSAQSHHLAYVTYLPDALQPLTGVMVEHRHVMNFLLGMDHEIASPGTWLAVTDLNCDRCVLDLCWTLCRGCHVILAPDEAGTRLAPRPLSFSLSCFPGIERRDETEQYRLLLDSAAFAEHHGFAAVWTPEHRFHAPDGRYPNPSMASAAIAAIALNTARIQIRGGSVALMSHHPFRVAEEWVLIDNLSQGRLGLSATGWHHDDVALSPAAAAERLATISGKIEVMRDVWRGTAGTLRGFPAGGDDEAVHPRPVQPDLPIWMTATGHEETFVAAGKAQTFVLTHLTDQTVEQLGARIALYRAAWKEAGHAGDGHVTLMLPSFIAMEEVSVFEAMTAALSSGHQAVDTLIGAPWDCLATIARARAAGVDEIGCMIDFGLPIQQVLDHFPGLDMLRQMAAEAPPTNINALTALMERHGVTHLSCTAAMALALSGTTAGDAALARLDHLILGGGPVSSPLARRVQASVGGRVTAMFGAAETAVWCAAHRPGDDQGPAALGHALPNQHLIVVDSHQQPMPHGVSGELVIAGLSVARGYLGQAEKTARSFIEHPGMPGTRAWRSGMQARLDADGTLNLTGAADRQDRTKGEHRDLRIEPHAGAGSTMPPTRPPGQDHVIHLIRGGTPGDVRQVDGFAPPTAPRPPRVAVEDPIRVHLPEFSALYSVIGTGPLHPPSNDGGHDASAALGLCAPHDGGLHMPAVRYAMPTTAMERRIAALWCHVLGLDLIGIHDNFFERGGHARLTVQLHRLLHAVIEHPFSLDDIVRFPTIHAFSAHMDQSFPAVPLLRSAMSRRRRAVQIKVTPHA